MEAIAEIMGYIVVAIFLGLTGAGVGYLKRRFDLDPNGEVLNTLKNLEQAAAAWVIDEAATRGANLTAPETRWDFVNQGVEWLLPKAPKVLRYLGYTKEDLAHDIEGLVRKAIERH